MKRIKISTELTPDDTWTIHHQEITENKFSSHSIKSIDDFYEVGVDQIMTKVFTIDHIMDNPRDKTPQDREIKKIRFRVTFSNIRMKPPVTAGYCSGKEKVLMPNMAHIEDRTLASNLYVDANIETWAYMQNDEVVERNAKVLNFRLANIPTMVGSNLCNTVGKSKETLTQLHEDPNDPGAYFIKDGNAWVIDNIESIAFNQPRIFNNYWKGEEQRLELISKPGDTYQNSKQIIIKFMDNGGLVLELAVASFKDIQFPFFLIFRALGWSTDKQMIDNILYACIGYPAAHNIDDPLINIMYKFLEKAMHASYDTKNTKFNGCKYIHNQHDVLKFLVTHMPHDTLFKDLDFNKPDHLQQAINKFLNALDNDFLPRIGVDEASRNNKLRFFGHLINRMIYVKLGILEPTDRDSYPTKRAHTVGISYGKMFKTHFNASIVNQIRKQFIKDFKAMSFSSVNLQQTFQISVNGADFERLLMQSITSATSTTLKVNNYRTVTNRLSSQLVDRKNYTKILSTLRMIVTPGSDSAKGSARAKEMRMPHPSIQGFLCLVQSAEGGEKIGLHKQLAISASICSYGSSELLKQFLSLDKTLMIPIENVPPYEVRLMAKVFINGDWCFCTKDSAHTVYEYTQHKRNGRIYNKTSIEWDNVMNEIYFWVDYGRLVRPILIVYNNVRDYKLLGLLKPVTQDKFEQGIALTPEILKELKRGNLKMDDLLRMGIIEYITPQEQIRMDVASSIEQLRAEKNNILRQFSYCDIPESMFGISALTAVLGNYNQTTRNTFQTSQVRQTCGYYAYNWPYRIDKDTFLQYQVETPLVYTRINHYIPPNGAMLMCAVASYTGYNEEDSMVWNAATCQRLKYNGSWFTYDKVELEKNEQFAIPDSTKTTGIKTYANYSKLGKNAIVPIGTIVRKGDIIVGKIKRLPKNIAEEKKVEFVDQSPTYKYDFPAIVHNVVIAKDDEAITFVKVAYRSIRPPVIGDKFSGRSGQKSVVALTLPQSLMPFTASGLIPDIVMNPHSFPKRMTCGHTKEGQLGIICARKGVTTDGSVFRNIDDNQLIKEMKELNLDYYGRERLYSGITGCWMDSLIFVCPIYNQRLQKFVAKSVYVIDVGPTDIITRQPVDGKANQGGLRISELQRDVLLAHGCAKFFSAKFFDDSDDFDIYFCICGFVGIVNLNLDMYECPRCQDDADIYAVHSSWSSKQLFSEMRAMHIGTQVKLSPFEFYSGL